MWYMVCRKDAVDQRMKSSELFPVLVEADEGSDAEDIVLKALQSKWPDYTPKKYSYYVVPMKDAVIATFRPKQQYEVVVTYPTIADFQGYR